MSDDLPPTPTARPSLALAAVLALDGLEGVLAKPDHRGAGRGDRAGRQQAAEDWGWRAKVHDGERRVQGEGRIGSSCGARNTMRPAPASRRNWMSSHDACWTACHPDAGSRALPMPPRPVRASWCACPSALAIPGLGGIERERHRPTSASGGGTSTACSATASRPPRDLHEFSSNPLVRAVDGPVLPTALDANARRDYLVDIETLRRLNFHLGHRPATDGHHAPGRHGADTGLGGRLPQGVRDGEVLQGTGPAAGGLARRSRTAGRPGR